MLRIDGAYLYEMGAQLRPILAMPEQKTTKLEIFLTIQAAADALRGFLHASVFVPHIRTVRPSADDLLNQLETHNVDFGNPDSFSEEINDWQIRILKEKFRKFEAVLSAELQNSPLYLVFSKGGFDILCLTDQGLSLFPESLSRKVPGAVDDAVSAAKCIAFELFTAAGFHLHRANEAVLRMYFDEVAGSKNRPRSRNMGDYLKKMNVLDVGDQKVLDVLKSIKDLHRNPLMHPEDKIETVDEAISLYAAVRAAIGYMLDRIP